MSDATPDAALPGSRVPLRELPKVSLHDHLDGGLRPQTIVELADAIEPWLKDPNVAYLQAYNARPGCFAARIDRA